MAARTWWGSRAAHLSSGDGQGRPRAVEDVQELHDLMVRTPCLYLKPAKAQTAGAAALMSDKAAALFDRLARLGTRASDPSLPARADGYLRRGCGIGGRQHVYPPGHAIHDAEHRHPGIDARHDLRAAVA